MASALTRRTFLGHLLAANPCLWSLSGLAGACRDSSDLHSERATPELLISAQGNAAKSFGVGWAQPAGHAEQCAVGFRGHDVVAHPLRPGHVLLIGRHPGRELAEVQLAAQRVVKRVVCMANHELAGHACFSADGRTLFTTESDYELGQGRIVVRDADDYRVLDVFSSHGVGPHELLLMPDGHTLAVANGGLRTHPKSGRRVLNLDTMVSRLSFIDARNGHLRSEHGLAEPKASIRHLGLSNQGELSVALQMQREASDHTQPVPLAAIYSAKGGLQALTGPEALLFHCKDYMGSTKVNNRSRIAGFTSPRGDIALFWHIDTQTLAGYHRFHDTCGLAVSLDEQNFILSNSAGQVRFLNANTLEERVEHRLSFPGFAWDNHMRALRMPA